MNFKARLASALILSVVLVTTITTGHETKKIEPLPREAFSPVTVAPSRSASPTPTATPTSTPSPTPKPTPKPTKAPKRVTPKPSVKVVLKTPKTSGKMRQGVASYYCNSNPKRGKTSRCTRGYPDGKNSYYAAIRKDLLFLKGRVVKVCEGKRCLPVRIIDCNCGRHANLIDLYADAFSYFHPITKGTFNVKVRW